MKKTLLGLVLAASGFAGAALAAPVYPVSVISTDTNGTVLALDRSDPNAMIGPADGVFYSLGLGGNAVLDFGAGGVTTPGNITEVTFRLAGYVERVRIFVSNSLVFSDPSVAVVQNADAQGSASLTFVAGNFRYVKLVDFSPGGLNRDGFDVDSISFSPVPVPAAGLLLGGALFGLGALRRRAKKNV